MTFIDVGIILQLDIETPRKFNLELQVGLSMFKLKGGKGIEKISVESGSSEKHDVAPVVKTTNAAAAMQQRRRGLM